MTLHCPGLSRGCEVTAGMTTGRAAGTAHTPRSESGQGQGSEQSHVSCGLRKSIANGGLYGGNETSFNGFNRSGLRSSGGVAADPAVGRQ